MTHPTEEELALHHAGLLPAPAAKKVKAHVSTCARCRAIVEEAARGLSILASASEPPADLFQHARARRWAARGDAAADELPFEEADDIAEVSGRGLEADETQNESDDAGETDGGEER